VDRNRPAPHPEKARVGRPLLWTLLSLLSIHLLGPVPASAQERRPNVLLVLFDDVGFTDLGAYGGDTRTPHVDALARSGVLFSRYHTSPFCGPSRAMLMTGMDNHQVGMGTLVETVTPELRRFPGYSMVWDPGQQTIASRLRENGYRTYVTGKWGIGEVGANLPDRFGFDRSFVMDATGGGNYDATPYLPGYDDVAWFEDGAPAMLPDDFYSSRTLVDRMIEYIDAGDPEQPFFAFLSLQALHIPVQVPTAYIDAYDGVFDAGWDAMRQERWRRAMDLGLVPPTTELAAVPGTHRAWADLSVEEKAVAARRMQVNAGMMQAADEHIGRLLAHLDQEGRLDDTIVVVTSDNGPEAAVTSFDAFPLNLVMAGIELVEGFDTSPANMGRPGSLTAIGPEWAAVSASPLNLYKFYASEGGLRVPLVMAGPGIEVSGVQHAAVHVADLVPTLLDAAGIPYDAAAFYGRSFMQVLSGEAASNRGGDDAFGFEVSGNAALYRGHWKLTRLSRPLGDFDWRLYDLSVDPGETNDLSRAHPQLFEEMKAEYISYSQSVGVVELGADEHAMRHLFLNLAVKAIGKYWMYLVGLIFFLVAAVAVAFWAVRHAVRRRTA